MFRAGNDDAFRVIHDRYRQRLFAYTRQMLPGSRQDAEDALQDVFVRAYSGLRANGRDVALRAWLYRVAHNRCIDELRRPPIPIPELIELVKAPIHDPIAQAEQRESLRRLIADVRRLPEQQRSALLMRELSGMSYSELAVALGISVPAVKSLLVRARVGLAQAAEARETACTTIQDELVAAHDRRVRPNATARRHMSDCAACREFRSDMRGVSRQIAGLVPAIGPIGVLAKLLGIGGGAGGGAAASGGAAAAGGAATTGGAFAAGGVLASGAAGHVATILAAAVVTAGGAVEIQHSMSTPVKHHTRHHLRAPAPATTLHSTPAIQTSQVVADTADASQPPAAPAAATATATPKPSAGADAKPAKRPVKAVDQATLDAPAGAPSTGGSAPSNASSTDPAAASTGDGSTATTSPPGGASVAGSGSTPGTTSSTSTGGTPSSPGQDGAASTGSTGSTSTGTSTSTGESTGSTGSGTGSTSSGSGSGSGSSGSSSSSGTGSTILGSGSVSLGH